MELQAQVHSVYSRIASTLSSAAFLEIEVNDEVNSPSQPRSHNWLGPFQTYAIKCSNDGDIFGRFIKETTLPQLGSLIDLVKNKGRESKHKLGEAQNKLVKQYEVLSQSLTTHEKGWKQRVKLSCSDYQVEENEQLTEVMGMTDIFITEQLLRQRIAQFLDEKSSFCNTLIGIYADIRSLEGELANGFKKIITEVMHVNEKYLTSQADQLVDCINSIRLSEPFSEWQISLKKHKLDWEWEVSTPPLDGFIASTFSQISCSLTNSGLEPNVKPIRPIKSGFLMRPGTFGRNWNVLYCVLVDSAFLHCYVPDGINKLCKSNSSNGGNESNLASPLGEGSIRIPTPSMQLHQKSLSQLNSSAAKVFLSSLDLSSFQRQSSESISSNDFVRFLNPTISIPLLHPGTTILPDTKSADQSFIITVPGSGSMFGRGEKRYTFKSFVEEDMVDWCIALKDVVGGASFVKLTASTPSTPTITRTKEKEEFTSIPAHMMPFGSSEVSQITPMEDELLYFRDRSADIKVDRETLLHSGDFSSGSRPSSPVTPELENPWDKS